MAFSYHPPTRTKCKVCEKMANKYVGAVITTTKGKASSADNFPFHNWYNFVLGYTPEFPEYIFKREKITRGLVLDPFMGSGTTLICAKRAGLESVGIDANDFFEYTAKTKLDWHINVEEARKIANEILLALREKYDEISWPGATISRNKIGYLKEVKKMRSLAIPERYISDGPLVRLFLLKEIVSNYKYSSENLRSLFTLAFVTIILPVSNVSYGPGFGVKKAKIDADVFSLFQKKIYRMISDLTELGIDEKKTRTSVFLGDARVMSKKIASDSVDLIVTSPPYPGDHEYTKHSKLELIFMNFATNLDEFRIIKKRMLRGSTTNVYKDDSEGDLVRTIDSIKEITKEIDIRLKMDGATSGFEKLYTKLVWEYFGGMHKVFEEALKVLKPGGKFVLLVSDSHAFKMVHIRTAEVLAEVAAKAGFTKSHIELWQNKGSTSHKYNLFEEILTVEKPKNKKSK